MYVKSSFFNPYPQNVSKFMPFFADLLVYPSFFAKLSANSPLKYPLGTIGEVWQLVGGGGQLVKIRVGVIESLNRLKCFNENSVYSGSYF